MPLENTPQPHPCVAESASSFDGAPGNNYLDGHLPKLLEQIIEYGKSFMRGENAAVMRAMQLAKRDARLRARRNFSAGDLINSYQILRTHIFQSPAVELKNPAKTENSEELCAQLKRETGKLFDECLREAVTSFVAEETKNLRRLCCTDSLTGLYNHRTFYVRLDEELKRAKRYAQPLTIALIDLDDFKSVNDSLGHQLGDTLLAICAAMLRQELRRTDIVCRYGGDEFGIILPNTEQFEAHGIIARLPEKLARSGKEIGAPETFGMSFGLASFPDDHDAPPSLVSLADAQLMSNKPSRATLKISD